MALSAAFGSALEQLPFTPGNMVPLTIINLSGRVKGAAL
jgi:hypothetical protein